MYIEFQFINSKSKIFDDVTNLTNSTSKKKIFEVEILSRDCERTLTRDIGDSVMRGKTRPPCPTVVGR